MAEKEYIEREALMNALLDKSITRFDWSESVDLEEFEEVLANIQPADVVERSVVDKLIAERDALIEMVNQLKKERDDNG